MIDGGLKRAASSTIALNDGQRKALEALRSGRNVFLSGSAGTGKSYVLREYLSLARLDRLNVVVCAPTGIAALNVKGTTIHKAFGAKIGPFLDDSSVRVTEVVKSAHVIVIDEISMCRIDLFQFVGRVIQDENARRAQIGKQQPIQLIVVGDFFQLPPVLTDTEKPAIESSYGVGMKYAFQAPAWRQFEFVPVVLSQVVRQGDEVFVSHLNKMREGASEDCAWFEKNTSPVPLENAVYLCPQKKKAASINEEKLAALNGDPVVFRAYVTGKVTDGECPADKELVLKQGAQVIMLNNDSDGRWVNGTIATVARISPAYLYAKLPDRSIVEVPRHKWEIEEYAIDQTTKRLKKVVVGSFEQYPARLSYAITIHKSQGQTFECANIDPNAFDAGMLYVALSRVKTLDGIHLLEPLRESSIKVDPVVVEFYRNIEEPPPADKADYSFRSPDVSSSCLTSAEKAYKLLRISAERKRESDLNGVIEDIQKNDASASPLNARAMALAQLKESYIDDAKVFWEAYLRSASQADVAYLLRDIAMRFQLLDEGPKAKDFLDYYLEMAKGSK